MGSQGCESGKALLRSHFSANDIERFWAKVLKTNDCWLWKGARLKPYGHGVTANNNRNCLAHRFSYVLAYGSLPAGVVIRHKCDTPPCVRPDHLEMGTQKQNQQDRIIRQVPEHVVSIRRQFLAGEEPWTLARQMGLNEESIRLIIRNKSWHDPEYKQPRPMKRKPFQRHKLSAEQVAEIRSLYVPRSRTHGVRRLADKYGMAYSTIWEIIHQRSSHLIRITSSRPAEGS